MSEETVWQGLAAILPIFHWTVLHLSLGMSSKVAIDGPFEAVLGKTRRTEF